VLVMNAGRISGELPIEQCSEAALGRLMGGVGETASSEQTPGVAHRAALGAAHEVTA
jgi:hypothetical protein